jgi:DNA-binding MarR family transcriptional regulator
LEAVAGPLTARVKDPTTYCRPRPFLTLSPVSARNQLLSVTDISRIIARADRIVTRRLAALMGDEISVDEWRALEPLADEQAHTMSEVVAMVMLPAPTVTRLVDRLVSAGLVHRRVDDRDRRRVLVVIAPRGVELVRRVSAETQARTSDVLTADELERLSQAVELLAQLND